MRTYKDAKAMAKTLRDALRSENVALSQGACLEIVARQFGLPNWNTLAAKLGEQRNAESPGEHKAERPSVAAVSGTRTAAALPEVLERVPLIPLRDVVVYPGILMPIFIGRPKTIESAEMAMRGERRVALVTQRRPDVHDPRREDLYEVGTIADVKELTRSAEGILCLTVEGLTRAHLDLFHTEGPHLADITVLNDTRSLTDEEIEGLRNNVLTGFEEGASRSKFLKHLSDPQTMQQFLATFRRMDPSLFVDKIASFSALPLAQKQELLEILDVGERLRYLTVAYRRQAGPTAE